jgi:hypothetical protein
MDLPVPKCIVTQGVLVVGRIVLCMDVLVERSLQEGNPISPVFQNIDPPSPSPPGECVPPPLLRLCCGGGQTRRAERGMGDQYFGRREK